MRLCSILSGFILLAACGTEEPRADVEARGWLAMVYGKPIALRNVRRVGEAICGEANLQFRETNSGYRPFYFSGADKKGAFFYGERILLPDQVDCPYRDEFLMVCAPTPQGREAAGLRHVRCTMGGGL